MALRLLYISCSLRSRSPKKETNPLITCTSSRYLKKELIALKYSSDQITSYNCQKQPSLSVALRLLFISCSLRSRSPKKRNEPPYNMHKFQTYQKEVIALKSSSDQITSHNYQKQPSFSVALRLLYISCSLRSRSRKKRNEPPYNMHKFQTYQKEVIALKSSSDQITSHNCQKEPSFSVALRLFYIS